MDIPAFAQTVAGLSMRRTEPSMAFFKHLPPGCSHKSMNADQTTFALFFGNRGFFPASLIAAARQELSEALQAQGHRVLMLDESATRFGAVESPREGEIYANFLRANRGKFSGVILCLPNFGDETGAVAALQQANVPILVQAYPDELEKMAPAQRRDAFCGKLSIMDVFRQYSVRFTALKPHVVRPGSAQFKANVDEFARTCRVVAGVRGMVVGAIGARTTPFKTVRIDEATLQRYGITVETLDLGEVIARVKEVRAEDEAYQAKLRVMAGYARWEGVPNHALEQIVRLAVTLDALAAEYRMDALALRCWTELQAQLGISPCVVLGELNGRGLAAACEVDVGNAVAMRALSLASGQPATCLDWNNNYQDEQDKCIVFHCGPVPRQLMAAQGCITDHAILANALGPGKGYGCNVGRLAPTEFTFSSLMTEQGKLKAYLGQGRLTADPIPREFFGCAGVAEIPHLEDVLLHIGKGGHRHHLSLTPGWVQAPLREALEHYLDFEVALPQANHHQ
jgi:L-fucose isomerase-like protein